MPYCEPCDRFYNPNTLTPEGGCPSCGTRLDAPARVGGGEVQAAGVPWHFWVLLVAVVAYLGWRLVQGADALFGLF